MIPYIAGAQALTLAAVIAVYFHGQAKVADCQRDSAADAMNYEQMLGEAKTRISTLQGQIQTQKHSMEVAEAVASSAAAQAAERAIRRLNQPRPPVVGHGPEVMNQWLD